MSTVPELAPTGAKRPAPVARVWVVPGTKNDQTQTPAGLTRVRKGPVCVWLTIAMTPPSAAAASVLFWIHLPVARSRITALSMPRAGSHQTFSSEASETLSRAARMRRSSLRFSRSVHSRSTMSAAQKVSWLPGGLSQQVTVSLSRRAQSQIHELSVVVGATPHVSWVTPGGGSGASSDGTASRPVLKIASTLLRVGDPMSRARRQAASKRAGWWGLALRMRAMQDRPQPHMPGHADRVARACRAAPVARCGARAPPVPPRAWLRSPRAAGPLAPASAASTSTPPATRKRDGRSATVMAVGVPADIGRIPEVLRSHHTERPG